MATSLDSSAKNPSSRFETRPLHEHLGLEVIGFDFSAKIDSAAIEELRQLADHHLVLLIRGQKLVENDQVAVAEAIGPLIVPVEPKFTSTTNSMILRLGNIDMQGKTLLPDDPATKFTYAPEKWHSDGSYKVNPNYLSILHGVEIPPEGGETWFASMVAAYEALPQNLKKLIADKKMEHPYPYSGMKVKDWKGTEIEVVTHAMVRNIPGGLKALYLSPFSGHILGMPADESDALVKELMEFATGGQFTYKHQWQQYDTLIWNNRGLVHTARPWDRVKHRRLVQRVEIARAHSETQLEEMAA